MTLRATVVDPVVEPVPGGWDDFVTRAGLLPWWDAELLRTVAWCSRMPSSLALVREAGSDTVVAGFQARHLAPRRPGRFVRPGERPPVTLTECRGYPVLGSGVAFADGLDQRDRVEAVRVFERALRRRIGPGAVAVGYRHLTAGQLAAVPVAGRRLRLRLTPSMVIDNAWSDLSGYLGSLTRRWRYRLADVHRRTDADRTIQVGLTRTVDPVEACWLVETVRRQHLSGRWPPPTWPVRYFARWNQLADTRFLVYRSEEGRLLAFLAIHDNGQELVSGMWGRRSRPDGGRDELYFDQFPRMAELMIRAGRRRMLLGVGMAHLKARCGARPEPRWGVVGLR